jgi:hypothetical protein
MMGKQMIKPCDKPSVLNRKKEAGRDTRLVKLEINEGSFKSQEFQGKRIHDV